MKSTYHVIIAVGIMLILTVMSFTPTGITGWTIVAEYLAPGSDSENRANRLHDDALEFFDVEEIIFPNGVCIPAAHELYGGVAYVPIDTSVGYSTSGPERISTLSFVIDRTEKYGTIDFVKTATFLASENADSLITLSTEAIVRVPKRIRTTYLIMDLYGNTVGPFMYITGGRFSTPSTDCIFLVVNGRALCDCDIHTIKGIAVGGILVPSEVEGKYDELRARAEEKIEKAGGIGEASEKGYIAVSTIQPPIPVRN